MARRRLSNTRRDQLFADRNGLCHLCGGPIQEGQAWDVSHVIPIAVGGSDDETNWDVAHRKCHRTHTAKIDQPTIAKVERIRLKHTGAWRSRTPIRRWSGVESRDSGGR